jgi:hypothetical protein
MAHKLEAQKSNCSEYDFSLSSMGDSDHFSGLLQRSTSLTSFPEMQQHATAASQDELSRSYQHACANDCSRRLYAPVNHYDHNGNNNINNEDHASFPYLQSCISPGDQVNSMNDYAFYDTTHNLVHFGELPLGDTGHDFLGPMPFEQPVAPVTLMNTGIGECSAVSNQHQSGACETTDGGASSNAKGGSSSGNLTGGHFVRDSKNRITNRRHIFTARSESLDMADVSGPLAQQSASSLLPSPLVFTPDTSTACSFFSDSSRPSVSPIARDAAEKRGNAFKLQRKLNARASVCRSVSDKISRNYGASADSSAMQESTNMHGRTPNQPWAGKVKSGRGSQNESKSSNKSAGSAHGHQHRMLADNGQAISAQDVKTMVEHFLTLAPARQTWYGRLIRRRAERAGLPFADIVSEVLQSQAHLNMHQPTFTSLSAYPALCEREDSAQKACVMTEESWRASHRAPGSAKRLRHSSRQEQQKKNKA